MAIDKKLYTQEIDATKTILQMCIILDKYVRMLIDSKEEKTDVTEKLKVIQNQINIIKTDVQNNTTDIATHTSAIAILNNQIISLNKLLENYKELNSANLQDLIKGSNDITVDLDPTQEHLIIKLDQDIKDNINNLDNNVTTLLSDVSDNTNNINIIKSPIAPILINSEGKLYLNFGDGLSVDDNGKLKSTGGAIINSYTVSGTYNYKYVYNINDGNDNKIIIPPIQSATDSFYMNSTYIGGYTTKPIGDTIVSGNSHFPTYFYNDNDTAKKIPVGIDYRAMNSRGDYINGSFQYNFMLPYLEYETNYNTSPIKYKMETIDYQDPKGGINNIQQPRLYLEYNENDFSVDSTNGKLSLKNTSNKIYNSYLKFISNNYPNLEFYFNVIANKPITAYDELLQYCKIKGEFMLFSGSTNINNENNIIKYIMAIIYLPNRENLNAQIILSNGKNERETIINSQLIHISTYEI